MSGPILIFDSGVGGLSVVAAMRARLPGAELAYVCDNAMLPYGTKADDWLVARSVAVCEAAIRESGACALVVACNTASTLALDALREQLSVSVIGTVPAIKPAARFTRSGSIALLATSATVNRPYTCQLIEDFAGDCKVLRLAADPLVAQAERMLAGELLDDAVVEACLAPLWREEELDTVVLGCTHFPLLRDVLQRHALAACPARTITWVDSGDAIARRVAQLVERPPLTQRPGPVWLTASAPQLTPALAYHGFGVPSLLAVAPRHEPAPRLG
ncbi:MULTISPECIES: glutamate racemase [Halomonadaceae]|uniref:glutamate racemase n=1 Tax=Halomonadaceae TaxID=28256 RepID=UPI001598ABED|nr:MULTISPECIES: glutamate racemase [Halomonas]QJQ95720.1 glutamate racemase [Halomonas sp. PA5]